MSVIVKGMEMPKSCSKCRWFDMGGGYGYQCTLLHKSFDMWNKISVARDKECPLIELPPHGDLVDRNEPHWIPVTEDTPKEAGTYMCTCYDAGRRIVTLAKWQPRTKTWNLTGARAYWKVIAWCKCPEPYKGVTT